MNAILIHPDGRAEVVFGDFQGDLTKMAVLTQAAVSALEEAGSCDAVQSRHAAGWITLLKQPGALWLRVQHEPNVTVEQVLQWASTLTPPAPKPQASPSAAGLSLADALNATMP